MQDTYAIITLILRNGVTLELSSCILLKLCQRQSEVNYHKVNIHIVIRTEVFEKITLNI